MKPKALTVFITIYTIALNMLLAQDAPKGLRVADKAPSFSAKSHTGESIQLDSLLKQGPVVLFFYRGGWCPYCNKQMSDLQDSLAFITEKGATVIGVTPETLENIGNTVEQTNASFKIIHDKGYKIMKSYKTAFTLDAITINRYERRNIDIAKANGNKENVLPVPATYIINKDGFITFAYFNADYRARVSVRTILDNL